MGDRLFKFLLLADQPAEEEEEDCEDDLKMESAKSESETEKSETEKMEESTEENPDSDSNKATMEESSGESPEPESEIGEGKETMEEEENGNSGNNEGIMDDNGDTEEKDSEETENTVRRLKPRTSSLDTIVLSYNSLNSLPESQYEGNSNLTQLFQPITTQSNSVGQYQNRLPQNYFQEAGQDSRPNRDSIVNPGLKQTNKEVNSEQCCDCWKYLLKVGISVAMACCQTVIRKLDRAQAKVGCL